MLSLRLFTVLAGFGASLGLWRILRAAPDEVKLNHLISGLTALLGAFIGARTVYVLAHPVFFSLHPGEAAQFWSGGWNAFGALAGAVLFTLLAAAVMRIRALHSLDTISLLLLPLATLIWLGLWYEGVAYGIPLPSNAFFSLPAPDETGMLVNRFPLQLAAAVTLLFLLWFIEYRTRSDRPGFRFSMLGLGFSTHLLVFSMFRSDQVFPIRGIRSDAFFSLLSALIFALLTLILLLPALRKRDKMKPEESA